MRRLLILAVLLAGPAAAAGAPLHTYRSVDGDTVPAPRAEPEPVPGQVAMCRDGTRSVSHHSRGTCSRHGGVAEPPR